MKLIIFDMDGVLVDIKNIHFITLNDAIRDYDPKYEISYSEHLSTYDGRKTFDKLNLLSKNKGLPLDSHQTIWRLKQEKTIQYIKELTGSKSTHIFLAKLKELGFILAVASNSIRETVKQVLLSTGYIEHIDFYYSNDDVIKCKPHSEIYLRCMLRAGVDPKDTIILEDSPIGIQGAENSGANVIHIKNTKDLNDSLINRVMHMTQKTNKSKWINKKLNILIPMAGAGSRFERAGYTFPKPLIPVNDSPMIKVVVDNLNIDANYIFIVQKSHYEKYNLQHLLNMIAPQCTVIPIEGMTDGAACTTLLAKDYINNDNPLLLANSDQFIEWDSHDFMYSVENTPIDGCILTFNSMHPKWSFVKLDTEGFVTEVAEKKPISDIATVGIYFWQRGSDYVKYAEQMIQKNIRVNNEFYVCPVYNEAILDNKKIKVHNIKEMWGIGTPEDLELFLKRKI